MSDPVGEIQQFIVDALACADSETMDAADAAEYLARAVAPHVVLRAQLEHVGTQDGRPVFHIPARTVTGTGNFPIRIGVTS